MEWIPVSKAFPEPNQSVRIKGPLVKDSPMVRFVRYSDNGWFWDNLVNHVWQSNEVTHWMKPTPPEAEDGQ